jgi:hypothetical protein
MTPTSTQLNLNNPVDANALRLCINSVNTVVDEVFKLMPKDERDLAEQKVQAAVEKLKSNPNAPKLSFPQMSDREIQRLIQVRHLFYGNSGDEETQQKMFQKHGNFVSKQRLFMRPNISSRVYTAVLDLIRLTNGPMIFVMQRQSQKFLYETIAEDLLDSFTVYYHAMRFTQVDSVKEWEWTFNEIVDRGLGKIFLTYVKSIYATRDDFGTRVDIFKQTVARVQFTVILSGKSLSHDVELTTALDRMNKTRAVSNALTQEIAVFEGYESWYGEVYYELMHSPPPYQAKPTDLELESAMRPMIEFRNQFRSYAKRAKEAKEALIVSQLDFKKAVQTVKEIMLDLALE